MPNARRLLICDLLWFAHVWLTLWPCICYITMLLFSPDDVRLPFVHASLIICMKTQNVEDKAIPNSQSPSDLGQGKVDWIFCTPPKERSQITQLLLHLSFDPERRNLIIQESGTLYGLVPLFLPLKSRLNHLTCESHVWQSLTRVIDSGRFSRVDCHASSVGSGRISVLELLSRCRGNALSPSVLLVNY